MASPVGVLDRPRGAHRRPQPKQKRTPPPIRSLWQSRAGRITGLDGFRGLGIAVVILTHVTDRWTPGGQVFVDIFFVLSGYVITRLLLREQGATGGISLKSFYRSRWTRLGPAQFVCVGVICVVLAIWAGHWLQDLKVAPFAATYTMDFYRAALPLGSNAAGVFAHTWSLAVEEQFYLLWPLFLIFLLRKVRQSWRVPILLTCCFATIAYRLALSTLGARMVNHLYNSPEARADQLLIGCTLAIVVWHNGGKPPAWLLTMTRWLIWPVLFGFAVAIAKFHAQETVHYWESPVVMTYSSLAGVILVSALAFLPKNLFTRFVSLPPFVAVGTLCYSLYVWHFPIVVLLQDDKGLALAPRLAIVAVLSLICAVLSWRYIETRFHRSQVLKYATPAEKQAAVEQVQRGLPAEPDADRAAGVDSP